MSKGAGAVVVAVHELHFDRPLETLQHLQVVSFHEDDVIDVEQDDSPGGHAVTMRGIRRISPGMDIIDKRIGLISDVHATVPIITRAIRQLAARGVKQMHSLGDFAIPWNGHPEEELQLKAVRLELEKHDATLLITGGNHEGYDEWEKVPVSEDGIRWIRHNIGLLPRGWRALSPAGNIIASLGGANSIDRYSRRPHRAWWPQESITPADLAALGHERVDILLGHDVPQSTALLNFLKPNERLWSAAGLAYAHEGHAMFHRGVQQVTPRMTIGGHYHLHLDSTERFTDVEGRTFETRVIVMDADGRHTTVAVLDTDALDIIYPEF